MGNVASEVMAHLLRHFSRGKWLVRQRAKSSVIILYEDFPRSLRRVLLQVKWSKTVENDQSSRHDDYRNNSARYY
jgi:hypothetical protein